MGFVQVAVSRASVFVDAEERGEKIIDELPGVGGWGDEACRFGLFASLVEEGEELVVGVCDGFGAGG